MTVEHIQFVAHELLSRADFLIPQWLPDGKRVGHEWVTRNPTRQDAHPGSFKINLTTGVWCDFATGDKGTDLVSIFAYLNHLGQGKAAKWLAEAHGLNDKPYTARSGVKSKTMWEPLAPIPANAPPPPQAHFRHGKSSCSWAYRNRQGAVLCYVVRFDLPEGKQILPLTYCRNEKGKTAWRWRGLPEPRPLYNLDTLTANPQATVIICEGEKATDACSELFSECVTTTTLNGAKSPHKTDFMPLSGRTVWLWPDTDEPGRKYAEAVGELVSKAGAREVKLLHVSGDHPSGWDAADALAEGWQASKGFELLDIGPTAAKAKPTEQITREQIEARIDATEDIDVLTGELVHLIAEAGLTQAEEERLLKRIRDKTGITLAALRADLISLKHGRGTNASSVATRLVRLAEEAGTELWHDPDLNPWATLKFPNHTEHHPLKTKAVRHYLQRLFYKQAGEAAYSEAVQAALGVLEANAIFDGKSHVVFVRVAEVDNTVYLDLANDLWQVVRVTPKGWELISASACPVRFRRARGLLALPVPIQVNGGYGNKIGPGLPYKAQQRVWEKLARIINVSPSSREWKLIIAWLLALLRGHIPYPMLVLNGEQGSGKSTAARLLRALIDPNTSPLRTLPKGERDLFIAATNSWVQCFDNVSGLSDWVSDALCRLATGGALATRELYTDNEETLLDAMRPCILNGITDFVTRPDLVDRAMLVTLPAILEENCKPEAELLASFEAIRPRVLGALLTVAAEGLRRLPAVKLDRLPRLADFTLWVTACEEVLGWKTGSFQKAFTEARREMVSTALDAEPIVEPLRQLAGKGEWIGSTTALLGELEALAGLEAVKRIPKGWPKSPDSLGKKLTRLAPALRLEKIAVERLPKEGKSSRPWRVRLVKETSVASVASVGTRTNAGSKPRHFEDESVVSAVKVPYPEAAPDLVCDTCDTCDTPFPTHSKNGEKDSSPENPMPSSAGDHEIHIVDRPV